MVMNDLYKFSHMTDEEIESYFKNFTKENLCDFSKDNNLPYRKYYSRSKILKEVVDWVCSTMMF
jgi:hypothetical protein